MAVEAASVSTFESVVGGLIVTVVSDDTVVATLFELVRDDDRSRVPVCIDRSGLEIHILLDLHSIHASLSLVANRHFSSIHHCSCSTLSLFFNSRLSFRHWDSS